MRKSRTYKSKRTKENRMYTNIRAHISHAPTYTHPHTHICIPIQIYKHFSHTHRNIHTHILSKHINDTSHYTSITLNPRSTIDSNCCFLKFGLSFQKRLTHSTRFESQRERDQVPFFSHSPPRAVSICR